MRPQYQQSGNARKHSTRCEVFALRKAFERTVSPPALLTDNLGVVWGLDRGEAHCTSDKNSNADEWKNIYQALRQIEEARLENQ